jgi:hypothetical protein
MGMDLQGCGVVCCSAVEPGNAVNSFSSNRKLGNQRIVSKNRPNNNSLLRRCTANTTIIQRQTKPRNLLGGLQVPSQTYDRHLKEGRTN